MHRTDDGRTLAGRIVETEAYCGPLDAASHARSGPGGRAALMFGQAGVAYVYLIYGVYHCFNAVTEAPGYPAAVLVRALEPAQDAIGRRASGPGLLCQALEIDRALSGADLTQERLFIAEGEPVPDGQVRMGPRIGVDYAGPWAREPWRFWVAGSPLVSRRSKGELYHPGRLRGPQRPGA